LSPTRSRRLAFLLLLKGIERSGRIAAWTTANKPDDVPQLTRRKLRRNVLDAPLMEQINSRYHRLGHTLNGGPSQRCIVENESERIA
jgi:hypothetical protein